MRNDFTKLGLDRRSRLSLASSISPVEEAMDDVDEINDDASSQATEGSNGSSSTIEEVVHAVDMQAATSGLFEKGIMSPLRSSMFERTGDARPDPNAVLLVNLAGAYLASPEIVSSIPHFDTDVFEAAFDVSFKHEQREPKVRLRR